ncbi:hypothetical protein [Persicitalea sp.]|uniref:hypothetical protein n=1 Tax=Persicitalea sp. TaxID=3100273 RepID=UPI00359442B2
MKRKPIPWGRGRPANRLLSYTALLAVSLMLSCAKKEFESICDENCCDTTAIQYEYVTEIKDAEADYGNGGFWLKNPINNVPAVNLCDLSVDKVKGLENTFDPTSLPESLSKMPFAYRISGRVYNDIYTVNIIGRPVYWIRLDNVKKIK